MSTTLDFSDKNVIGNSAWKILHAYANQYPENPTVEDKKEFHSFVKSVLRTIPDDDCKCRTHAIEYIQKNKPTMNNRQELVVWTCNFHNDVNKRLGKHEFDCKLLSPPKPCLTCKPQIIQDKDSGIKQAMANFKADSIKVFEELCKQESLPMPRIVFAPCPPPNNHTSCTIVVVKKDSQDVNTRQTPVVYINPGNFGLRVLVHEMKHYVKKMKKQHGEAINEDLVEKEAQDIIKKYFPADTYVEESKQLVQPLIMRDSLQIPNQNQNQEQQVQVEKPKMEPIHSYNKGFNPRRFRSSIEESFPMYTRQQRKHNGAFDLDDEERGGAEGHYDDYNAKSTKSGLLSYLDGLYEPVAKLLNVSPRELNLANTPNVVAEGTKMLMNTQLTPFGSVLSTAILGITMFIATALNKEAVGLEDRRLMVQLGGQFLWSGLQYANAPEIQESAMAAGQFLASQQFDKVKSLIVRSSSFLTEAQAIQQAGVNARSQQRGGAGVRTGSGGISTGSGPVTGINRGILAREQQKASGVQTKPEGAGIFRNFGSEAGQVFAKDTSSGGSTFTYVPNVARLGLSNEEKELLESSGMPTDLPYYDNADELV